MRTKLFGAVMAALVVCGCGSSDGDSKSCAAFCARAYADCKRDITQSECEATCHNSGVFPGCAARETEHLNCEEGLGLRLHRCALQVQARGASAQADGLHCSDVLAGDAPPPFPDEWAGEMPLEVVVLGERAPS